MRHFSRLGRTFIRFELKSHRHRRSPNGLGSIRQVRAPSGSTDIGSGMPDGGTSSGLQGPGALRLRADSGSTVTGNETGPAGIACPASGASDRRIGSITKRMGRLRIVRTKSQASHRPPIVSTFQASTTPTAMAWSGRRVSGRKFIRAGPGYPRNGSVNQTVGFSRTVIGIGPLRTEEHCSHPPKSITPREVPMT